MGDAWPEEVVDFLRAKSKELDPAKKGVHFVITSLPPDATKPKEAGATVPENPLIVTYSLQNVSILDALLQAAKQSKLEVTARRDGIFVHSSGKKP